MSFEAIWSGSGRAGHLCIDVQVMFAEETEWHAPWLKRVLPAIEALVEREPARTVFTRFVPPANPEAAVGAWRDYYRRWESMTLDRLGPAPVALVPSLARYVPPARIFDKVVYSPWWNGELHAALRADNVDTLIVTGGETDVCVLTTVLGAIDLGYRIILPTDALFGSADETHDAVLALYSSRFGQQLATCSTEELLDNWERRP